MIGRRPALIAAAAGFSAHRKVMAQPRGRVHALLVGINSYRIRPLRGCVNDVRLMERNLRAIGAQTTILLEAQATRSGFDARWREVTSALAPGDTLIFHFAGHGLRAPPNRQAGQSPDHGDFLVFRDFHERDAPGEILLDHELHALLIAQNRRGVQPIVVLDCCHAGALTRSVDPRAAEGALVRTMAGEVSMADVAAALARRPPPPPPPPPATLEPILFLAAGQAIEVVPEIDWMGRQHGALSVGFATAVSGEADQNRDGVLSRGELFNHILVASRTLAESRQHPVMQPPGRLAEPILSLPTRTAATPSAERPAPAQTVTAIRLSILNMPPPEAAALIRRVPNAIPADAARDGGLWDLRWDARSREAWGSARDRLSGNISEADLPAVVQRVRAQQRLAALALRSGLEFRLIWPEARNPAENDAAHPQGRHLELRLAGLRFPYLLMFNLAGNGAVQQLHPGPNAASPEQVPISPSIGPPRMQFVVTPPFGVDLAVALCTSRPMPELVATMRRLNRQLAAWEMVAALEGALAGLDWQLAVHTVVTRES